MRRAAFVKLLTAALPVLLLTACSLAADITPPPDYQAPTAGPAASTGPAFPLVVPDPARAVDIFAEKCAPCHGASGKGDGPQSGNLPNPAPAIGSAEVARLSVPSDWYAVITTGRLDRFMPGFSASLSDSQRWDVIAYVYSLSQPDTLLAAGEQVFQAECADCHTGGSQGSSASQSATPPADFSTAQISAALSQDQIKKASEAGIAPDMPAYAGKLSEDDLWAVSAYIQTLGLGRMPGQLAQAAETETPVPQETALPSAAAGSQITATPEPGGTASPTQNGTAAASMGSVSGQVINGSGGPVPDGLVVTLRGFDDMNEALTMQTSVDSSGKYLFKNVEMPAGRVFMMTADYDESVFNSDVAHSVNGNEPVSLDLMIYDRTSDISGLKVDRLHVLFDFTDPANVQVVEMFIISNPTQNVVIASQPGEPVLEYGLPAGATNLQFQDGEIGGRYVKTTNGFGDLQAISPGQGQHQLLFAYDLPYDQSLEVSIPVPLAVDAGVVMVPEGGIKVTSSQLEDGGTRTAEGTNLHIYSASNLPAGSSLELTLKGRPGQTTATSALGSSDSTGLIIGLAAFGLLIFGLGAWVYFTKVKPQRPLAPVEAALEAPTQAGGDPDGLMDAIIALDDQYRTGGIPEQAYRQRRAELKQQLAAAVSGGTEPG